MSAESGLSGWDTSIRSGSRRWSHALFHLLQTMVTKWSVGLNSSNLFTHLQYKDIRLKIPVDTYYYSINVSNW